MMTTISKRHPSNSTSEDDDDADDGMECPLSGAEALAVCKEFASMTETNTGLAMMMLQKNEWNLQRAVNAYHDSMQGKSKASQKQTKSKVEKPILTSDVKRVKIEPSTTTSVPIDNKTNAKTRFKVLSWNIDGLDEQEKTIDIRTRGVIDVIKREEPDAVFLQEVISIAFDLIRNLLPEYDSYAGNTEGYFVVILTRRELFKVQNFEIIPYPGTNMGRNLLIVHTMYKNSMEIDLMTSHHESGTEEIASKERMEQLKLCFKHMTDAPSNRVVLFGGDLNIREKELQKVGNVPLGIVDLWIETGKRKECAYTWDMNRNTNIYYPSTEYRPRARFDRLYYRPSTQTTIQFQPVYFELEGLEKLASIKRYCSDHWAIQAYFDI
ncbi:unnamed protein product [Adineta steineri]|uniref:Tyrosyl-DNA phosphodiesterase 2 n=1 Tax=Adineta steineri TaxID=433720 RepID=A0A814S3Z6_9BILA|nr:unnamed protein product [Adineta steineri]CAF1141843.1 unnamed protein product [Adineta steineri]CAF3483495.1 unnamed protein product [Adineta steineri]CAF3527832.1 unnamed protein product [Adineta steineri]